MNCQKAYSKLLVLSRAELGLPTNIELIQHLHSCPFCDSFREIWLKVDKDIEKGFQFSPPENYWDGFAAPIYTKTDVKRRSIFRSLLWKLDWLIYPEKTLKWAGAFCLIVGMTFGGIKLQQFQSIVTPGLPNNLEISRFLGNTNVLESFESGISLGKNTVQSTLNSDDDSMTLSPNS